MTIPMLGPSWLPKIGALLALIVASFALVPDTAPGMAVIKPWLPFFSSIAIGLVGFTTRQAGVTSEAQGIAPAPPKPTVPLPPNTAKPDEPIFDSRNSIEPPTTKP